jgi:hypothetical protein
MKKVSEESSKNSLLCWSRLGATQESVMRLLDRFFGFSVLYADDDAESGFLVNSHRQSNHPSCPISCYVPNLHIGRVGSWQFAIPIQLRAASGAESDVRKVYRRTGGALNQIPIQKSDSVECARSPLLAHWFDV